MKICENGTIREATAEELAAMAESEPVSDEPTIESLQAEIAELRGMLNALLANNTSGN